MHGKLFQYSLIIIVIFIVIGLHVVSIRHVFSLRAVVSETNRQLEQTRVQAAAEHQQRMDILEAQQKWLNSRSVPPTTGDDYDQIMEDMLHDQMMDDMLSDQMLDDMMYDQMMDNLIYDQMLRSRMYRRAMFMEGLFLFLTLSSIPAMGYGFRHRHTG